MTTGFASAAGIGGRVSAAVLSRHIPKRAKAFRVTVIDVLDMAGSPLLTCVPRLTEIMDFTARSLPDPA
jgi:hypothetical protein